MPGFKQIDHERPDSSLKSSERDKFVLDKRMERLCTFGGTILVSITAWAFKAFSIQR